MSRVVTSVAIAGVAALAGSVAWIFSVDQVLSSAPIVQATAAPRAAPAPAPAPVPNAPAASTQARTDATPSAAPQATTPPSATGAPQAQAATAPAPGSAGQRVSIDPKTGALRPIEHDEAAGLAAASAAQARGARKTSLAAEPQQSFGPGGSVTVDIPEDLHTYTVATRRPDGSIAVEHATGPTGAKAKVKAGAAKKASTPAVQEKEDRDDR